MGFSKEKFPCDTDLTVSSSRVLPNWFVSQMTAHFSNHKKNLGNSDQETAGINRAVIYTYGF